MLSAARPLGSKAPKRIIFVAETQKKDAARAEPIERLAYMLNTSGLTAKVADDIAPQNGGNLSVLFQD